MAATVDKEFVTKLLGEPVQDVTVAPGSKIGDNVAGSILSVAVTTAAGRKLNLVHKGMVTDNPFIREYLVTSGAFRIENAVYGSIAPAMGRFAESRGATELSNIPVPHFYGGFNNDDTDYLCMEDMRSRGFVMPDKWIGLNLAETKLVMLEMARFHALAYAFLRWQGEQFFDSQPDYKRLIRVLGEKETDMASGLNDLVRDSAELIGRKDPLLAKHARNAIGGGQPSDVFGTSLATDSKFFATLVHGDLWLNNILIRRDEKGEPVELRFIDFQQTRRGNIFEDLQYFMFTSTMPEFRRQHLNTILNTYYDSFCRTLDRLNWPLPANFSRGFFLDSFFGCYMTAYRYLCFAIPLQLGAPMDFASGPPPPGAGDDAGPVPNGGAWPGPEYAGLTQGQIEMKMMVNSCKMRMEGEPKAVDRLIEITRELVELKVL